MNHAVNFNRCDYYVTGETRWDDGRVHRFDNFKLEPIVCPFAERYGPEIPLDKQDPTHWSLPPGSVGYTVTYLTCEKLNAVEHEREDVRSEEHCGRLIDEWMTED
ncbi:MAG: hypothetical protein AB9869_25955 [Verrucomicrobiia bacterium]